MSDDNEEFIEEICEISAYSEFVRLECDTCKKLLGFIRYGTQEEVLCPDCL